MKFADFGGWVRKKRLFHTVKKRFLFVIILGEKIAMVYQEKKKINKKDKTSHHKNNYLVLFCFKTSTVKKAIINARDKKNALRLGFNRLCRQYPDIDITRARIGGVFDNRKKTIKTRIGRT